MCNELPLLVYAYCTVVALLSTFGTLGLVSQSKVELCSIFVGNLCSHYAFLVWCFCQIQCGNNDITCFFLTSRNGIFQEHKEQKN